MPDHLFKTAPSLCPWYFNDTTPKLLRNGQALRWRWIEKIGREYVGAARLEDKERQCFGVVKPYAYILPNPENNQFLIWTKEPSCPPEFTIDLFATNELQPIENHKEILFDLRENEMTFFFFNCKPRASLSLAFHPNVEQFDAIFPAELKSFPNFCLVTQISGLYKHGKKQWNETAIILVQPDREKIAIFPQDWFNQSDADFGYQWITRAVVNPKTGLIHGQGIRIDDFILDQTNRQLQMR